MFIEHGGANWGDVPMVVNPWDEYALEEAIRTKEQHGGQVTALVMGPETAREVLKTAIAMGCDSGVMLTDEALDGCDARITACVLASAIKKLGDVQLAIFGKQAIDGDTGLVPVFVACALGWTPLSYVAEVNELDLDNARISVARSLEEGRQYCSGALPAVISVVKEINEPRYPSFIGIRKASKAKIQLWGVADLGIDIAEINAGKSAVTWVDIRALPARGGSVEIIDGDNMEAIAANLADRLVADKVI